MHRHFLSATPSLYWLWEPEGAGTVVEGAGTVVEGVGIVVEWAGTVERACLAVVGLGIAGVGGFVGLVQ